MGLFAGQIPWTKQQICRRTNKDSDATCSDVILKLRSSAIGFLRTSSLLVGSVVSIRPRSLPAVPREKRVAVIDGLRDRLPGLVDNGHQRRLQTPKVHVFDADGARLNKGWGDVTSTILTELQLVVWTSRCRQRSHARNLSFVLCADQRKRHRCELRSACVPVPAHVVAGWHRVLLQQVRRHPGGVRCGENELQHEHPVPRDGPERCRH